MTATETNVIETLAHFTGTEGYHRTTLSRNTLATDGMLYLFENAGAFWLGDIVGSVYGKIRASRQPFMVARLSLLPESAKNMARFEIWSDTPKSPGAVKVYSQLIPWTDFPFDDTGRFEFYVTVDVQNRVIMMLKSEY